MSDSHYHYRPDPDDIGPSPLAYEPRGYAVLNARGDVLRRVSCSSCEAGESTCACVHDALEMARKAGNNAEVRRGKTTIARVLSPPRRGGADGAKVTR